MTIHYQDDRVTLHHGDCLDVLAELPDCSVDAVVTDPPYGLEFMGKAWDRFDEDSKARAGMSRTGYTDGAERLERPSHLGGLNPKCRTCGLWQRGGNPCRCEVSDFPNERRARSAAFGEWCELWAVECLRVLKPGGHLLSFGGSRTWHRLACAVEDAGFEIRDSIAWLYGSGFPKSLDVSKAIDRAAGAEREVVGVSARHGGGIVGAGSSYELDPTVPALTAPATDAARAWQGWGTALKPAFEPIVVARKPLAGTVAGNVLAHGTGALNIDACRVEANGRPHIVSKTEASTGIYGNGLNGSSSAGVTDAGRWPANVLLDGSQADALDEQVGELTSGANPTRRGSPKFGDAYGEFAGDTETPARGADTGGASRFFPTFRYEAKADAAERPRVAGVAHPTVKPLDLMRWLIRLVTPPGGTVLDPFAGSGTTIEAALLERVKCIGIERELDYLPLIMQRIHRRIAPLDALRGADPDVDLGLFGEEESIA